MTDGWCDLSDATDYLEGITKQFKALASKIERMLGPAELIYEDIYTRIFDDDGKLIIQRKWRRLSVLFDALLYLSYILTLIYFQGARPNRHVRGSRRSDC